MAGSYARSSWPDLPTDLLLGILQRLQLLESLAFASVCASWRRAVASAGVPSSCRPWLMSWTHPVEEESQPNKINCSSVVTCKFRHLLDVNRSYSINFPEGCFVVCAGASHGWLVLVNQLSNLLLFNPITSDMVPLPPITDFSFVEATYDEQGSIEGYLLSCAPSKDGDCIAMIIHYDSNWLSFVRAGEGKWQVVSTIARREQDRYADCAYHNGRFYTVTYHGIVSTPWGDLLQIRAISANRVDRVRFLIGKVHPEGCQKVSPDDLAEHAIFVGLNHSACLSSKKFPGLRPRCIYFSSPWMTMTFDLVGRCRGWGGVRLEHLQPLASQKALKIVP
ncbi:hypothetical protein VPH35_103001 [Triticum aestivum]